MSKPASVIPLKRLEVAEVGSTVLDKIGVQWVRVPETEGGEWLSSGLEFTTTKELAKRRPRQPAWFMTHAGSTVRV